MTLMLKTAVILVGLYALLALGARLIERRLMYFPDTTRFSPESAGLAGVEERILETADGQRVVAWYAPARPGQPTLLYFHGNGGSLETRSERIRKYMARGIGVFMMTYRGYGGSSGAPSEAANVGDAKLAYDTLAKIVEPSDIVIYGESLGSGVATQVAAEKRVGGVILDAPYTSMVDLAALHYPQLPLRLLMRDRYETLRYIGKVTAPLLIVHGEEDDIVPVEMGRTVFAAARSPKEIATFPGAGHGDHYLFGSYDKVFAWIERLRSGVLGRAAG
jgi:fermentation-respiration switch protein FrsA (DUF1100 family)